VAQSSEDGNVFRAALTSVYGCRDGLSLVLRQ
jgi:hypothetical protein